MRHLKVSLFRRIDPYRVTAVRLSWYDTALWVRGSIVELVEHEPVPAMAEHVIHALMRDHPAKHLPPPRPPEGWIG